MLQVIVARSGRDGILSVSPGVATEPAPALRGPGRQASDFRYLIAASTVMMVSTTALATHHWQIAWI